MNCLIEMKFTRWLAIALLTISFCQCIGQNKNERPKVGLVLSGGGAKGIAHIGVLKALEQAGIVPDYITGTSMGSIVGGLYAAGYSADELRNIVEQADWNFLLSNKIPFNQIAFEEKEFANRYLFDFYLKNKKLILPKGIIEGQALMELFSNLTRHVHGITDFNDLPIPFACVGADIVTGKPVVLNKGSLAMSMRASMSIPSIFVPVKIDDHLLVDGGIVHNMPVSEVIDMGADIVIGVFVSSVLEPEENLTSPLSIITQSAFLGSAEYTTNELKKCYILVKPNIDGISTGSFAMAPTILERGEEAGKDYFDQFKKLADSLNQFGPPRKIIKPAIEELLAFHDVEVVGISEERKDFIIGKLNINEREVISISEVDARIEKIYATQYFEKIWYELQGNAGNRILRIYALENPQTQFRFAYHYDSENKGGIVVNGTFRNIILNRSRFILEGDLATFPRITADYLKYIGRKQILAFQTTGVYASRDLQLRADNGEIEGVFSDHYSSAAIRLQTTRFLNGAFGVEGMWTYQLLKPKIVSGILENFTRISYSQTALSLYYKFDNTNDRYFPTKGLRTEVKLKATTNANGSVVIADTLQLSADQLGEALYQSTITSAEFTLMPFVPLHHRLTLIGKLRVKISNLPGGTLNFDNYDFIGGFIPNGLNSVEYYGAGPREYALSNYFYSRLGLQYQIASKVYVQGFVNYLDAEYPGKWFISDEDLGNAGNRDQRIGYAVFFNYASPIGPIGVGLAKDHHHKGVQASLMIGFYY